jgi:hypothetical protein
MAYIGNPIYQSAFVTDTFSGNGSTTAFTMSVAPAGTSNVLVAVSGVLQDPSTYGVVGTTINFSTAPPSGTGNISCRYLGVPVTGVTTTAYRTVTEFTATASQTTFTPPSYTVGFINVYRNGVLLGSADYTASNGTTVVLATGATAGDLVTVESFQISSVANAIQNTAGSVSGTNIATGAVTPAKLSTGGPYWDTSGNLGVGTTSPLAKLSIGGGSLSDANVPVQISSGGSATETYFGANKNGSYGALFGYSNGAGVGTGVAIRSVQAEPIMFFTSSNVERMKIDSSGRVTMPFQPCFYGNPNATVSATNKVTSYTNTRTRGGITFSSGVITVPVAGEYGVLVNAITNGSASLTYSIRKNGGIVLYSVIDSGSFRTCAMLFVVQMAANDYLELWVDAGTMHSDAQYNSVSVFLLG